MSSVSFVSKYDVICASLNLFKAVPDTKEKTTKKYDSLKNGVFITDDAYDHCNISYDIYSKIISDYGFDLNKLNNSFKTFKQVANQSLEELFADQVMHYFTTYGLEALGVFNHDYVYIPNKELNLPEDAQPIKVTVINYISTEELRSRIVSMLSSGIALKKSTQDDILNLIMYYQFDFKNDIENFKNKEFNIRLYDYYNITPKNGVEWLRYVVYKITGSSMLIKNKITYQSIVSSGSATNVYGYFATADFTELASIFYRYKLIFLAIKKACPKAAYYINQIRRLANQYHRPVKKKILDRITSDPKIDFDDLKKELQKVTIYKKISLANAILFRRFDPKAIAYFVRNGRAFASEYNDKHINYDNVLNIIMKSIVDDIRPQVEGKSIYIPENMTYAMPTSEKLFWGHIPFNSYIQLKKDVIVAVHWMNKEHHRVDLDLHMNSHKYNIGWNTQFTSKNDEVRLAKTIIFSGDMTTAPAPKGATEAYYVGSAVQVDEMIMVNLNNFTANGPVDFQFVIDSPEKNRIDRDYLINSHTMNYCMKNVIQENAMFLGFLDIKDENKKFYFTSATMGNNIVSRYDDNAAKMLSAIRTKMESCLKLDTILKMAGAVFTKDDDKDWDINLDPQQVTKDVFISMLVPKTK